MSKNVLVVGSGAMAKEYIKVLQALNTPVTVVGRSATGVENFKRDTGIAALTGGLEANIGTLDIASFTHCIVATNVTQLHGNVRSLLLAGAKKILVEKPFVLDQESLDDAHRLAKERSADVFIAYNRRFFSSVIKAREIIEADGGLEMVKFDFTEWAHVIEGLEKDPYEKARWLLANSTHVIDLAFHFAGTPKGLTAYRGGALSWHPSAKVFSGAGISQKDVLFSYGSDWGSAGRWWLELFTPLRKLRLCPMEKLLETRKGTVAEQEIALDDEMEKDFKPGLYRQTELFLSGNAGELCTLSELQERFPYFCDIAGYPKNA
ncbi:Gfo/Idh/MocA family oxidoreductase [Pseudomonas lopnurensis]|uniref:Gfo/Idh/MocA family oxidoreductase n=1 Tax=Pseudomonas lopnurensis TaxID=1477517 RepID=UPI0028B201AA|nr:Gfo/Idh/MocA family oxidoreductase [Pseudomonas lopnurensis]